MQQTAKPCVMCVCMILANFNLLSVTPQREKVTSPSIYLWVCMTCLFLKWSNTANFIRVERRGGSERWEERLICICIWSGKCKWTKWSDKRKMWIPLCSYLQIEKKRDTFFFFFWTDPFTFVQNDSIRHLINCWGSILKFLMMFSSRSE